MRGTGLSQGDGILQPQQPADDDCPVRPGAGTGCDEAVPAGFHRPAGLPVPARRAVPGDPVLDVVGVPGEFFTAGDVGPLGAEPGVGRVIGRTETRKSCSHPIGAVPPKHPGHGLPGHPPRAGNHCPRRAGSTRRRAPTWPGRGDARRTWAACPGAAGGRLASLARSRTAATSNARPSAITTWPVNSGGTKSTRSALPQDCCCRDEQPDGVADEQERAQQGQRADGHRRRSPAVETRPHHGRPDDTGHGIAPERGPDGGEAAPAVRGGRSGVVKAQPDAAEALPGDEGGERMPEFVGDGGQQPEVPPRSPRERQRRGEHDDNHSSVAVTWERATGKTRNDPSHSEPATSVTVCPRTCRRHDRCNTASRGVLRAGLRQ